MEKSVTSNGCRMDNKNRHGKDGALLFGALNDKTLYVLIPAQERVDARVGEVPRPEAATHPCDKLLIFHEGGDLKRAPGKLHTIIVGHGGVGPVTEARPVPDSHKADIGTGTRAGVEDIGPLATVHQGNRFSPVEAYGELPVGLTLPARDDPDARIKQAATRILQCGVGLRQRRC